MKDQINKFSGNEETEQHGSKGAGAYDSGNNRSGYRSLGRHEHRNRNAVQMGDSGDLLRETAEESKKSEEGPDDLDLEGVKIPFSFIFRPAVVALIILVVCFLALFMAAQALRVMEALQGLPLPLRWAGSAGIWLLLIASAGALFYLIITFLRLKTSPSFELPGSRFIDMNQTRRALQKSRRIKREMDKYLKQYPLETPRDRQHLIQLGLRKDEIERIIDCKNRSLKHVRCSEYDWLKRFHSGFLSELDAHAIRRIRRYSLATGITTAAFPIGLISASVVLINSYQMISDLCRLYRLRTRAGFTLVIFAWSFVHTLAASRLGEFTEESAETLMSSIEAELESGTVSLLGKRIAPKLTEGAINGLLIRLLGKQAIKRLRPLNMLE